MPRESSAPPSPENLYAPAHGAAWPMGSNAGTAMLHALGQPTVHWLEQTLAVHVCAFKAGSAALHAATEGVAHATGARQLLEIRDTLLAVSIEEQLRWQTGMLDAWHALQRDLVGPWGGQATAAVQEWAALMGLASGLPPGTEMPVPAAQATPALGDEAWRQWQALWKLWPASPETSR